MPDPIKMHIACIIRKHTEQGAPLHEVVDELAKEYEELLIACDLSVEGKAEQGEAGK